MTMSRDVGCHNSAGAASMQWMEARGAAYVLQ